MAFDLHALDCVGKNQFEKYIALFWVLNLERLVFLNTWFFFFFYFQLYKAFGLAASTYILIGCKIRTILLRKLSEFFINPRCFYLCV